MAILMRLNIYREYLDLSRNQKLLKQLVTRRGIPVLDNIQLGLQKIKNILAGEEDPVKAVA
jgi:raw